MRFRTLVLIVAGAIAPSQVTAQAGAQTGEWGDDRALELMRRAQDRRAEAAVDTGLVSYRARALGRVYFYLDREDTGERNLVKTDQLALDVLWQAPDLVKQRIVGWRDDRSLPTNIQYHLDHLSVVQENFGDEILIGDGDEVRGVVHPAAPIAERFYEYRLADSLTLALPGASEPVRVYRVDVRPRDPARPGFVGAVFVERRLGDIVRMDFTFTAAAYVDPYLDYINISLDNGLWRGRYWLPNEQRVELRRRIPQLDIPAGSVIRANMRLEEYEFNQELPLSAFQGPPVVALPRREREAFPFEEPIDAELRAEGLGPAMELDEIRAEARRLVREQALRQVGGARLGAERLSEVVRYNRAEGLALGAGIGARPRAAVRLSALAGYAFAAGQPFGRAGVTVSGPTTIAVQGYANRIEDVGIGPAAPGLLNSLTALFAARDYLDPYFASGVEATASRNMAAEWTTSARLRVERHSSARLESDFSVFGGGHREVREMDGPDRVATGEIGLEHARPAELAGGWSARISLEAGTGLDRDESDWLEPRTELGFLRRWRPGDASLEMDGAAGALLGDPHPRKEYLLGGRGTVPGFAFRSFSGERFAMAGAVASADLAAPWVRGRVRANVGWSDGSRWSREGTGGARVSAGIGAGLLYDVLRIDLVRGLGPSGRWEVVIDTRASFRDFL